MKKFYQVQMKKAWEAWDRVAYGYWCGRLWGKPPIQAYNDTMRDVARVPFGPPEENGLPSLDWLLLGL